LVRAYTDATKAVLEILPRAEKIPTHTVMFSLPYTFFEQARLLVSEHRGQILDEEFAADVTITARFMVERFVDFQAGLRKLTHGKVEALVIETNPETIMPLGSFEE
jgi:putative IMPACT (imprinted ancient) family translation regulator